MGKICRRLKPLRIDRGTSLQPLAYQWKENETKCILEIDKDTQVLIVPRARCSVKHSRHFSSFLILSFFTHFEWTGKYANHFLLFSSEPFFYLSLRDEESKSMLMKQTHTQTHTHTQKPWALISAGNTQLCLSHMWQKFSAPLSEAFNGRVYRYFCMSPSRGIADEAACGTLQCIVGECVYLRSQYVQ